MYDTHGNDNSSHDLSHGCSCLNYKLESYGNMLRYPDSRYLQDGILELRCEDEVGAIRILYFFIVGRKAVLTNGFVKKKDKTPVNEILLAKARKAEYLGRES